VTDRPPEIPGGAQLRTIAMPRDTNPSGSIFGGWTLSQMDLAGATLAGEHAAGHVATVSIEAMRFLRPVSVGDEVSCYCTLQEARESSLVVKIETWARERGGRPAEKVTEGVFTYVAIGEDGRPHDVAPQAKQENGS
jgi:acyl-CoA thioesterase YciA